MNVIQANLNILKGQYRRRILAGRKKKGISQVDEQYLDRVLENFKEETVFIHCGLSNVKRAFNIEDPYDFLIEKLSKNFSSILVPGFTLNYFKDTAIYHKKFSHPHKALGAFSKLFYLKDTDYRTNDCIHSILVKGSYSFDECNHFNSFSVNGCFGKLDRENILILNIGTDELKASQLHFVDYNHNVNITKKSYKGIIYYSENKFEKIKQANFEMSKNKIGLKYNWNRPKIVRNLKNTGILQDYSYGNFNFYAFKSNDLKEHLGKKIQKNPYYLIT